MPLYEYECTACHRRTEKIQKFSDPELTVCPHCGGRLERTVTAPAFNFAGGGWYKDLYSSTKPGNGNTTSSSSASTENSSSTGSTSSSEVSKPAAAPTTSGSTT